MKRWIDSAAAWSFIAFVISLLLTGRIMAEGPEGAPSEERGSAGEADGEKARADDDEDFLGDLDASEGDKDDGGRERDEGEPEKEGKEVKDEGAEGAEGAKWGGRLRDHAKQGVINLNVGTGYFFVAPYDKNNPDKMCEMIAGSGGGGDPGDGEPVCGGRSGFFLEFLGGYGLKPGLELLAIFRLGLEQPDRGGLLNQPKVRQFGVGLKFYNPDDGLIKLGVGVAPLFDFSNRGDDVPRRYDLVIHVPILLQFDVFPWFGPYAQAAVNVSFISEFRLEITGAIGVQGRFP